MIVYNKKSSYFVPEEDAHLVPLGSLAFSENGMIFVNDFEDVEVKEEIASTLKCQVVDTLCQVKYLDNEVRVLYPTDTAWKLQNGGGDKTKYYFGVKIYAPNNEINGFKESDTGVMTDNTMYSFENNDFAGIESNGDKYSIIWLPAAVYDEANDAWTYYGAKSTVDHRVGWDYIVEWYKDEELVGEGKLRINLTNEDCHE